MRLTEDEETRLFEQMESALGPTVRAALRDDRVVEICLNEDGFLRIERLGEGFHTTAERVSPARAASLLKLIATLQDQVLNRHQPILETYVPGYGARIEGVVSPVSSRAPVFAIRRPTTRVLSLADYVRDGRASEAARDALLTLLAERASLLVVGGTGSGKTTLINALLVEVNKMSPNTRLVILEDTCELIPPSTDCVQLETSRDVDLDGLLRVTLRMRPDRIVVGEVRGREALGLLRAWNTGHEGGMSSVHANSAQAGLLRLEQLASLASAGVPPRGEIVEAVKAVVFLARGPNGPCVRSVMRVNGLQGDGYQCKELA